MPPAAVVAAALAAPPAALSQVSLPFTLYDPTRPPAAAAALPRFAATHASGEIVVLGSNLAPMGGSLLCRFKGDARTTVGRFLNGSAVGCPTLPSSGARDSSVALSTDAGVSWSSPGVRFTFYGTHRHAPLTPTHHSPPRTATHHSPLTPTHHQSPLRSTHHAPLRTTTHHHALPRNTHHYAPLTTHHYAHHSPRTTTHHHSPQITTTHPYAPPVTTTHHYAPPLTTNYHHSPLITTYHLLRTSEPERPPLLRSLSPQFVDVASTKPLVISLLGDNFAPTGDKLQCGFGVVAGQQPVAASFVSSGSVRCEAPRSSLSNLVVHARHDGATWSAEGLTLLECTM